MSDALVSHDVPGGAAWSVLVRAGRTVRLTAMDDAVNCSMLVFPTYDLVDRMNVPDTLKAQMSAHVRPPMVLMSDRGVGLVSVTGSSLDWHDCLGGHSLDAHLTRFGPSSYGDDRNEWRQSARSLLLTELMKHGRGRADLHPCVNFFGKVATSDDGALRWVPNHSRVGDWVTLRAEVDLLLVLATCPHPMDPTWAPGAVAVQIEEGDAYGPEDPSMTFRDESARALDAARTVLA